MLLQGKHAVIYGAAGAIGSAVARTFAREGATVHLAGRTLAKVEALAAEIPGAHAAEVDALDPQAVREHAQSLDRIDVSFNAIGLDHIQGMPLTELSPEDFIFPITTYATTQFLTSTAAARRMTEQRSGVIITLSTTAARVTMPSNGFGPACAAVEALTRQLAGELGPSGVRAVCLRPDGVPETLEHGSHAEKVWGRAAEYIDLSKGAPGSLLQRSPTLADVAEVAAFLASDRAGGMTGTVTTVTCGSVVD